MYKYHCLNPISAVGMNKLDENYVNTENADEADVILVRSAKMHEMEFGKNLKAIARAGAGVNNIPLDKCAEEGIVVFNTPGANANGVKELVIAGMLLAARDVVGGIQWVQEFEEDGDIAKIAEKKKKAFAGTELSGKKLGVIGLGAIGVLVANVATHLGMEVYGYDPYVSVDSAWRLSRSIHHATTVDEIYKECDYITIHVPALDSTKGMIDKNAISLMKEIRDFLENGNITHSVNYPDCNVGVKADGDRITILHRNVPNMIGQFTTLLAQENQNIALMTNKSKKEYAYTVIDVDGSVSDEVVNKLESIADVLGVRVIK